MIRATALKSPLPFFILLGSPLLAAGASPERPLRWCADAEGGAPYIFRAPEDPARNTGFEVELAAALGDKLGRRVEFVQYDYKSLIPGVERGDCDFAMNGIEVTPDRARRVRFSAPYYRYREQLVVRRGETRFADLAGCRRAGCAVGTLEDTAAERMLDTLGISKRVYDGQVEPYRDLELGRTDAVLLDLPIATWYAAPDPKLAYAGAPTGGGDYAIALAPANAPLAEALDHALASLRADGTLRAILEKYRIWTDDQAELGRPAEGLAAEANRRWTVGRYLPLLLRGAWLTILISFASMALAVALGLPVALSRLYGPAPLRWAAAGYVEFFRGIPVLLLLYFLYYGLPAVSEGGHWPFALRLSPLAAAILGLGLNYAAYEAEIYRAGIGSIPAGQWEAAESLAMPRPLAFRRIILPQAIRVILPPMTNDFVALFKDTSIVSVIAVVELSKQYQILSKSSLKYLEIGLATALLYLAMSVPLGALARRLEKKWGRGS